ncbi:bifunctional 4-hydroxy-2-oxoglutarate aldolase/2-dehydro-3-deoxy-phosphogluconate aldolase [Chromatocurvus halotolerans]|uniref:bifunctional 4-hydroxy-2-oxoglutarate aldolase/2-dehydro-3-deoxy-phosphogluconate aldolase n=1 Tax=Chromatocurvus halotolerans TaxID=1132028 RepID=UPI001F0BBC23|nr:bifunctional 4-hydroxy-2-oxoglutarate aldolase/2-dehydro-3-deoxy-phosphogluconate aldolase [Chromatocurvus halotolerans]
MIPILTVQDPEQAVLASEALARGGMTVIEITLRTAQALASIRAVKEALPSLQVAAGTVLDDRQMDAALAAGSDFCVSPGLTPALLRAARDRGCSLLPGVATASDIMCGLAEGFQVFKLFPAMAAGGVALLRSLSGPFPDVRFCPTGGVTRENLGILLAEPNVLCCGGSWMASQSLIDAADWAAIEGLASAAQSGRGTGP